MKKVVTVVVFVFGIAGLSSQRTSAKLVRPTYRRARGKGSHPEHRHGGNGWIVASPALWNRPRSSSHLLCITKPRMRLGITMSNWPIIIKRESLSN